MFKTLNFQFVNNFCLRCYIKKLSTKANTQRKLEAAKEGFPYKILTKKQKTPAFLYLANEEIAQKIQNYLTPFLQQTKCDTFVELNPGIGVLTQKMLTSKMQQHIRKYVLMESMEYFAPKLEEIQAQTPERVAIKYGDITSVTRSVFLDKIDNGQRTANLLELLPKAPFNYDINFQMFGAFGSYSFYKHLINSFVFQNSFYDLGRFEMYLVIPPPIYIHLTCDNEIGFLIYRATSMLFQMLFEYRFIAQLPREHFYPLQTELKMDKKFKLFRVNSISPKYLYLVKIVPRSDLYHLCAAEDLPALWYFVKQNCVSRRNRVIPNLEKWIPGCGPRLIIPTSKKRPVTQLYDDEDLTILPKFSKPCTTMSCYDRFPNINIYTEFGDLTPSQMLSLFKEFRSWPEYSQSSFLASLENSLLKMQQATEETIDAASGLTEEDDAVTTADGVDAAVNIDATNNEQQEQQKIATTTADAEVEVEKITKSKTKSKKTQKNVVHET